MLRIVKNSNLCLEHFQNIKSVNHVKNTIERILNNGGLFKKDGNSMVLTHILETDDINFLNLINKNSILKRLICIEPEDISFSNLQYAQFKAVNTLLTAESSSKALLPNIQASLDAQLLLQQTFQHLFQASRQLPELNINELIEEQFIRSAYEFCQFNQVHTAKLLGVTRNVIRTRLIKYGLL